MEVQYPTAVAISCIHPGLNPRTYFDPVEMAELEASVREKGIIQAILVRPTMNGHYAIVAGERRYRAAKAVFGDDHLIPVLVKDVSDEESDELGTIENTLRADMSPTEEAEAAARAMARCKGDHEEAARRLGWSPSTLEKRLALMNCSKAVRTALNERRIQLGHAELLAAIEREKQDKALDAILKNDVSVAATKAMLMQIAKSMSSAIFNKDECAACPHNSDNQSVLFGESVGAGNCTNAPCYDKKTEAELVSRRDALVDEFPRVEIVRPGDQYKIIKLVPDGQTGVGEEQAKACRGCANFGAVVSGVPDKLGRVYKDQCFDIPCNTLMIHKRIKAEAPPSAPEKAAKAGGKKSSPGKAAPAGGKKTAPTVQDSTRIKEYRVKVWRASTKKELLADAEKNLMVLIALGLAGEIRNSDSSKLTDGFAKVTGRVGASFSNSMAKSTSAAAELTAEQRQMMHMGIAASAMENIGETGLVDVMKFLALDLRSHWKLNADYLGLLTKSEIEALCDETGLKRALGDKFAKTMGQKKDDIVKSLLTVEGFDYAGVIPRAMQF